MIEVTMEEAQEFFTKMNCDAYNEEELCREIWRRMLADERETYFRQAQELRDGD